MGRHTLRLASRPPNPAQSRRESTNSLLTAGGWGDQVGGKLSSAVLGDDGARRELALPLAATYSALDSVEGLDVDAIEGEGNGHAIRTGI